MKMTEKNSEMTEKLRSKFGHHTENSEQKNKSKMWGCKTLFKRESIELIRSVG